MANKHITFKDKEKVKQNLALGKTYRESMKGTAISSTRTVSKIAKESFNEIEDLRESYLKLIEKHKAGIKDRAKSWATMTKATKFQGDKEIPDWSNRREALIYIDSLAGISKEEKGSSLMIVKLSPELDEFVT